MPQPTGQLIVAVGQAAITVTGASTLAINVATMLVATGGAAALVLAGYGVYHWLSLKASPLRRVDGEPQKPLLGSGRSSMG